MNASPAPVRRLHAAAVALMLLAGWHCPLYAQGMTRHGDVIVHTSAIATLDLTREVAQRHAVTRSARRALLTIAVQRDSGAPMPQAMTASVRASATNPTGQRQDITLREVRDGEAIYYLGEPRIDDGELLRFEIEVRPEGAAESIPVRFAQRFYAPLRH